MAKKTRSGSCCTPRGGSMCCCKVESVISIDERGQMVLPKEIRDKANIQPGDKLAVVTWERGEKVCCISLVKADDFGEMVKGLLGPVMKDIIGR